MNNSLTLVQVFRLEELEKTIADGQRAFVDVGNAIMEIREQKLYRKTYATFEEYCKGRWGWGIKRAQQLARAAEFWNQRKQLAESTGEKLDMPANERQARAMRRKERKGKLEYVGKEPETEEKERCMPARQLPGSEIAYVEPRPAPTGVPQVVIKTPVVPISVTGAVNDLLREALRIQNSGPAVFHEPAFRHLIQGIINLQRLVQPSLPGFEEPIGKTQAAPPPAKKGRCTEAEAIAYCRAQGLPATDGEWFYAKMEGCGWKNGGKAVADWQQTVRAWKLGGYMASQKRAQSNGHGPEKPKGWGTKELDAELERLRTGK